MGVDKGREDNCSAFGVRRSRFGFEVRGSWFADGSSSNHAAAIDFDPPVTHRRRVDGQDPCGAVNAGHQCPVRRAFFSVALRAE
jgi:hypothetical protein